LKGYKLVEDDNLPAHILVVEDDFNMRRVLRITLEVEGYRVSLAATGMDGLKQAESAKLNLILFDLGLPDCDGIDLITDLRTASTAPIIVLTGRSMPADKIAALDAGADDYICKPFDSGELLARVRAQLRRPVAKGIGALVEFSDVRVDFSRRIITRKGEKVHLTPTEFRLLSFMLHNADKMLTKRQLMNEVWGAGHAESSHYLRTYVVRLRQKLEDNPDQPRHILTEVGMGYRFVFELDETACKDNPM
jgi:two-component system KDP operon response regulator KdpE